MKTDNLKGTVKNHTTKWDYWLAGYVSVNVLMFLAAEMMGCKSLLVYGNFTAAGTLFSHFFVHVSALHLLLNMVTFSTVFASLRRRYTPFRILFFSWLLAVIAARMSVGDIPVAGASGWVCVLLGFDCVSLLQNRATRKMKSVRMYVITVLAWLSVTSFVPAFHASYHWTAFVLGAVFAVMGRYLIRCLCLFFILLFCWACGSVKRNTVMKENSDKTVAEIYKGTERVYSQNGQQEVVLDCIFWEAVKIEYDTSVSVSSDTQRVLSKTFAKGYRNKESVSTEREEQIVNRQGEQVKEENIHTQVLQREKSERRAAGWYGVYGIVLLALFSAGIFFYLKFYK